MFDCFGERFVPSILEKKLNFQNGQKSRKNGTNMDIILSFLAKSVDKHSITLVHITYPPLDDLMALLILAIFTELLLICAAKNFCCLRWEYVKRMAKIALKFAAAASPDKRIIKVLIIFFLSSYIFSQSKVKTTYRLAKIRLVCEQSLPGLE